MQWLGILGALVALVGWGVGDFLVQKLTRKIGNFRTLFYNGTLGFLVFLPFAWPHVGDLIRNRVEFAMLLGIAAVVFLTALINYEALRKGKIAVIAPVLALELPLTVMLAVTLNRERLTLLQALIILIIFIGVTLVLRTNGHLASWRKPKIERGVAYALIGVLGLAFYNYTVGTVSQSAGALLTVWIISAIIMIFSFLGLLVRHEAGSLHEPLARYPGLVLGAGFSVIFAGLGYAYATTQIPISIAIAVSEGYVALSVILGLLINREHLRRHQFAGIVLVLSSIITLALITT